MAKRSGTRTVHALELVHRLSSPQGEDRPNWPVGRRTTNRQVSAILRRRASRAPERAHGVFVTASARGRGPEARQPCTEMTLQGPEPGTDEAAGSLER